MPYPKEILYFVFEIPNSYLISADFSYFDHSVLRLMVVAFINCEKLVSLDFSNFNTSNFIFGLEKGTLYTLIDFNRELYYRIY